MNTLRVLVVVATLIAVPAAAQAPRWGGGGPGITPHSSRPLTPYDAPYGASPHGAVTHAASPHRLVTNGGTWDGSQPAYGGSPPATPRATRPDLNAFFGYVPPRPTVTPRRPDPQPPQRTTREAYLERFGTRP